MSARLVMAVAVVGGALILAGCSTVETAPATVSVAVFRPCPTSMPPRPVFPTESLALDADIWTIGTALWAEILAREAYELQLATRLQGCIEPAEGQ